MGGMTTRRPRTPEGLGAAGKAFWAATVAAYELNPAELVTLAQCCRVTDLLARADTMLADTALLVKGSTGQVRANPLIASTSDMRRVLDQLIRSLALPMPDETEGRRRSPAAVASAQARWRKERGGQVAG